MSGCEPAAKIDDPAEDLRDLLHSVEIKFHTRPLNHTGKHGVDPGGGEIEPERLFCGELAETLDDPGGKFLSGRLRYPFNDRFGLHENPRPSVHSPVYMVGEGEHVGEDPDDVVCFRLPWLIGPRPMVYTHDLRCLDEGGESSKKIASDLRVPSLVFAFHGHRLDLLLDRQQTDVVEDRCVHQIGLLSRMMSHGLCDAQGDIGDALLMVCRAGVDQIQRIRKGKNEIVQHYGRFLEHSFPPGEFEFQLHHASFIGNLGRRVQSMCRPGRFESPFGAIEEIIDSFRCGDPAKRVRCTAMPCSPRPSDSRRVEDATLPARVRRGARTLRGRSDPPCHRGRPASGTATRRAARSCPSSP